ncbi:glutathione S-transferase A-like [Stegastes partitus]|uniref:Glutathione S-transferase A-like n=1 Tax=Stegastes partitus TaxID=144197 RepID=A0A3B5AZG6_9TELE|nr:PREDICTED: glutathione S-transferase A-like [Stegastes partitus]
MAESMRLLWGSGSPPCWRVMIALEEKNLQGYESKVLSFEEGGHKSPEVLEINPRAELPAFKHGDNIVNESAAACLYLESQFKSQGNKLTPDSPAQQALMYQRLMEGILLTAKIGYVAFYDYYYPVGEQHDSTMKRNKEKLTTEFKLWERYLQNVSSGSYLAGPFSLADVVVFPDIAYAFRFGLSAERYPNLAKYYNLLKERPSIKATWQSEWMATAQGDDALKDI